MSERPPGDGPSPWDDVINQVSDALDGAGFFGADTRDAVLDVLGDALDELALMRDLERMRVDQEEEKGAPDVTVVDGGRQRNQPRSRKPRPELRVADGAADGARPEGDGPRVHTRVFCDECADDLGIDDLFGPVNPASTLHLTGRIELQAEETQLVYAGVDVRPYRILCEEGMFTLHGEGQPLTLLRRGQSADIQAANITVSADGLEAQGSYVRLDEVPPPPF